MAILLEVLLAAEKSLDEAYAGPSLNNDPTLMHNVNDAEVKHQDTLLPKTIRSLLFSSAKVQVTQDVKSFLERPQIVASGLLQSTDTATTFPFISFPKALLTTTLVSEKIKGFRLFRGDLVLRLQVNGTRFLQGRYILAGIPTGGVGAPTGYVEWAYAHRHSLVQCTTLPHTELDITCETEAVLRLPFISCQPYYEIAGAASDYSVYEIFIRPYVALSAVSGTPSCPYTLWASFENVQLEVSITPQSDLAQESKNTGPIELSLRKVSKAAGEDAYGATYFELWKTWKWSKN